MIKYNKKEYEYIIYIYLLLTTLWRKEITQLKHYSYSEWLSEKKLAQ